MYNNYDAEEILYALKNNGYDFDYDVDENGDTGIFFIRIEPDLIMEINCNFNTNGIKYSSYVLDQYNEVDYATDYNDDEDGITRSLDEVLNDIDNHIFDDLKK